jgi:hypothetical protein
MSERRRPGRPATGQTPQRKIRMSDDRWQRFGEAAEQAGTDRTEATNRFAAWFTQEDDAELPERPD